jgi:hypothetical protein
MTELRNVNIDTVQGVLDQNNSTQTPLGIGGVFNGSSTDISPYSAVTVYLFADAESAVDGAIMEFSSDNINWFIGGIRTIEANNPFVVVVPPFGQYMRVTYTNGGAAQTVFELAVYLHPVAVPNYFQADLDNVLLTLPKGIVDEGNSYITPTDPPLGIGGVFTGVARATLRWSTLIMTVAPDQDSAIDGLEFQFSPDGTTWYTSDTYTIRANAFKIFTLQPADKFFRLRYTNGGVAQTNFHITTVLKSTNVKSSSHRVQESIEDEDDAELVKSVITARQNDGTYDNVNMDTTGSLNIAFGDGANLDAFSRLRISDPDTVFDATLEYDLQPLIYEAIVAAAGTVVHSPNDAAARLSTVGVGDSAVIQSRAYHRYIPGKGQLVLCTGNFEQAVAGVTKRVGYFDANDGVYYEQDAAGVVNMVLRSSVSGAPLETRIAQADWNIDKMDGTGRSAITLDPTKVYILVIEMQWLGMGRVRVGFDIDGRIYMVHQFLNANNLSTVYMKTANLPNRWEIDGDVVDTMLATCCSVQSEGGADKFLGYEFAYSSGLRALANGVRTPLMALRPALTFNGLPNRMLIELKEIMALQTSNGIGLFELIYLPVPANLVGGAWVAADAAYSGVEVNVTPVSITGGILVHAWHNQSTNQQKASIGRELTTRYPLVLDAAGAQYATWVLCGTGIGAGETGYVDMDWEEIR